MPEVRFDPLAELIEAPPLPEECQELYFIEMDGQKPPTNSDRIEALEKALGLRRRLTVKEWIKANWKQLAGASVGMAALLIGNLAWWQPRQVQLKQHTDHDLAQQIDGQIENGFTRHHFDDMRTAVDQMNGKMEEISGFLKIFLENQMKRVATFSPREFQDGLSEVKAVLGAARSAQVTAPPQVVQGIRAQFVRFKVDTPEYWGATSAMINYLSPPVPQGLSKCTSVDKVAVQLYKPDGSTGRILSTDTTRDSGCLLDLDEHKTIVGFGCNRCIIKYSGGQLTLSNVEFTDCIYIFAITSVTPSAGKLLAREILTNRTGDIMIPPVE